MHILLATEGTPEKQKEFQVWVKSLSYDAEGKLRKGYNKPQLSEVKFYDIRIKKECAPEFLRDLYPLQTHDFLGKLPHMVIGVMRKLLHMKAPIIAEGKPVTPLKPWFYSYVVGTVADWENEDGTEVL